MQPGGKHLCRNQIVVAQELITQSLGGFNFVPFLPQLLHTLADGLAADPQSIGQLLTADVIGAAQQHMQHRALAFYAHTITSCLLTFLFI